MKMKMGTEKTGAVPSRTAPVKSAPSHEAEPQGNKMPEGYEGDEGE